VSSILVNGVLVHGSNGTPDQTTAMRFRTDSEYFTIAKEADDETLCRWNYSDGEIAQIRATPDAEPGDTWRIHWHSNEGAGPVAGYAICCPKCKAIHHWTTALNCQPKPCQHEGKSSCWEWSGSAEENKLSASPSLYAVGACGWHGWLREGVLYGQ
jgi:hypothetical protein